MFFVLFRYRIYGFLFGRPPTLDSNGKADDGGNDEEGRTEKIPLHRGAVNE